MKENKITRHDNPFMNIT